MEVTQLRKELREGESQRFKDAQALLDAVDGVCEDAERYEDWLGQGMQLNEYDIDLFIYENAIRLGQLLVNMESIGVSGVLDVLLESQSYERILRELEAGKLQKECQEEVERCTNICKKEVSRA